MQPLMRDSSLKLAIVGNKPSNIIRMSDRFAKAAWLVAKLSTFILYDDIRPIFDKYLLPLDTLDIPFSKSDSIIYRASDTTGFRWVGNYAHGNGMVGLPVVYAGIDDTIGAVIDTFYEDAALLLYSPNRPFGLERLATTSKLRPDSALFMTMGPGFYDWAIYCYMKLSTEIARPAMHHMPAVMSKKNTNRTYNAIGQNIHSLKGNASANGIYIQILNQLFPYHAAKIFANK
jgi:hypothetical protein